MKHEIEFISTKGMKNANAPAGQVLVQYLEPNFGKFYVRTDIGFFDNPHDYENPKDGHGWLLWFNSARINVIAYAELPIQIETDYNGMNQVDFIAKQNDSHPRLGCVGLNIEDL